MTGKHTQTGLAKGSSAQQRVWLQQQPLQPCTCYQPSTRHAVVTTATPGPVVRLLQEPTSSSAGSGAIHAACNNPRSQPPARSRSRFQQVRHTHRHTLCMPDARTRNSGTQTHPCIPQSCSRMAAVNKPNSMVLGGKEDLTIVQPRRASHP